MSAPTGQSVEHGLIVVAWLFESERRYLFNVYEIGSPLAAAHGVDASDQKYFRRAPENQLEGRTLHQAVIGQRADFDQLEFGGLRVTVGEQNLPDHGGKFGHGHGAGDNNRVRHAGISILLPWRQQVMIYADAASTAFDAKLASRAPWMTVRPEEVSDDSFLHTLFLAGNPLAGVLPPALIEQQAEIRLASFRDSYPPAMRRIFEFGGAPIGRIMIDSTPPDASFVIDIGVLPEYRRRGVATAALKAWTDVADALGLDCGLTVLPNNPARALYARLGFVEETHREWDAGVHRFRLAPRGRDAGRREGGPGRGAGD